MKLKDVKNPLDKNVNILSLSDWTGGIMYFAFLSLVIGFGMGLAKMINSNVPMVGGFSSYSAKDAETAEKNTIQII